MDIVVNFSAEEWARLVPTMEAKGLANVEANMAGFFRLTAQNMVHSFERNQEYDKTNQASTTKEATDR